MIPKFDRGTPLLAEFEVYKRTPFSTTDLSDIENPVVRLYQPNGKEKSLDSNTPEQSAVGKYFIVIQTGANWAKGVYKLKLSSAIEAETDITVVNAFRLI